MAARDARLTEDRNQTEAGSGGKRSCVEGSGQPGTHTQVAISPMNESGTGSWNPHANKIMYVSHWAEAESISSFSCSPPHAGGEVETPGTTALLTTGPPAPAPK